MFQQLFCLKNLAKLTEYNFHVELAKFYTVRLLDTMSLLQKSISFQKSCCKRKSIRLETFLPRKPKSFFFSFVQTSEVWNLHFLFNFPSAQNCNALAYQITFLRPSSIENLWGPVNWNRYIVMGPYQEVFVRFSGGGSFILTSF